MSQSASRLQFHAYFVVTSLSLGLIAGAFACVGNPQEPQLQPETQVSIETRYTYRDGTPASGQQAEIEVLFDGADLFYRDSSRCKTQPDRHMTAHVKKKLALDAQGAAKIEFTAGELSSLVDATCLVGKIDASQIAEIRVEASIAGQSGVCAAFCDGDEDKRTCEFDCSYPGARLLARKEILSDAVTQAIADAEEMKEPVAALESNLIFNKVSERISEGGGPDLTVDGSSAAQSARISYESWSEQSCAVVEGCLSGTGTRRLLRFAGVIQNLGDKDFPLGNPQSQPDKFIYSACHNHYHLREAMRYELLHKDTLEPVTLGAAAVVGRKQGFCMIDMRHVAGDGTPKYTCYNQGLTSGWADVYGSSLDCQWLDITGVPAGDYVIRVTVNPGHSFFETNYDNNAVTVPYTIPDEPEGRPSVIHHGPGEGDHDLEDGEQEHGAHQEPDVPEGKPNVL